MSTARYLLTILFLAACVSAQPVITEFMAINSSTLEDGDGDESDWIEIHNPDGVALDLGGYFLSDDLQNLMRWVFPTNTILDAGGYLLVFASGKTTNAPPGELHTDFGLNADGEYLALTAPDGTTILSDYTFPAQRVDISFGRGQLIDSITLVATNDLLRYHVPSGAVDLATNWFATSYNDTAWLQGAGGLGFYEGPTGVVNDVLDGYWPLDEGSDEIAFDRSGNQYTGDLQGYNGNPDWVTDVPPISPAPPFALRFNGANQYIDPGYPGVGGGNPRSFVFWMKSTDNSAHGIIGYGNSGGNGAKFHIRINNASGNGTVGAIRAEVQNGRKVGTKVITDNQWHHVAVVLPDVPSPMMSDVLFYIDGVLDPPSGTGDIAINTSLDHDPVNIGRRLQGTAPSYWSGIMSDLAIYSSALSSNVVADLASGHVRPDSRFSYAPYIGTDVGSLMRDTNASLFARVHFSPPPGFVVDRLSASLRYDDGFRALLNGAELARMNVPVAADWNSAATQVHEGIDAQVAERLNWTSASSLVQSGDNVLAFQLLNRSATNANALLQVELTADEITVQRDGYFSTPSPGDANGPSLINFVADTRFSIDRGFYTNAIQVSITSETAQAEIWYTLDGSAPEPGHGSLYTNAIPIQQTTTLRAAAFRDGWVSTEVDTQTYIFTADVVNQPDNPPGYPVPWPTASGTRTADYGMDADVVGTVYSAAEVETALRTHPTLCLSGSIDDLFGPQGVYVNSTQKGSDWERAVSVEFIEWGEEDDYQLDAGLRMHGKASRSFNRRKHNMRLIFRGEYGDGRLNYRLFEDEVVTSFNSLVLRGGNGDSWVNPAVAMRAAYVRDQFHRDLQKAQGVPYQEQRYVHLYFNGLYWGLYHLFEFIEDDFAAEHFGGDPEDYDVIKHHPTGGTGTAEVIDGSLSEWTEVLSQGVAGLSSTQAYETIQQHIDIDNMIDYMLVNFYTGNNDWDNNNWRALRRRTPGAGWKFYCWDSERTDVNSTGVANGTWGTVSRNVTTKNNPNSPTGVHQDLRANTAYQRSFGDRAHELMYNGGPLSPTGALAIWNKRVEEIRVALRAESARWGDVVMATPPTPETTWQTAVDYMADNFFPVRTEILKGQLQAQGLYPATEAPVFIPHAGDLSLGGSVGLSHSNAAGTIYYTLDGTDPMDTTSNGVTAVINQVGTVELKARVLDNGVWSALNRATYQVGTSLVESNDLVISEIYYNPPGNDDLEYIELLNVGGRALNLGGVQFTQVLGSGIDFVFPTMTLLPSEHVLVVEDRLAFEQIFGANERIAGQWSGSLGNDGDPLRLVDVHTNELHRFSYDDDAPWPTSADGDGASLVLINPTGHPDHGQAENWRPSLIPIGSPGSGFASAREEWDTLHFTPLELTQTNISGNVASPDGDPFSNLHEFVFGGDPRSPIHGPLPCALTFEGVGTNRFEVFSFTARGDSPEIEYVIEIAEELPLWTADTLQFQFLDATPMAADGTRRIRYRRTSTPAVEPPTFYLRVRATIP